MSTIIGKVKDQLNKYLPNSALNIFAVLSFAFVAKKEFCMLSATTCRLWRWIPRSTKNLAKNYGEGSWALITRSTDDIGKAVAIAVGEKRVQYCDFLQKGRNLEES